MFKKDMAKIKSIVGNERLLIYLTFLSGIIISLVQFLYNRSLWLDEAMLALNIINKNNIQLLFPLDYYQVAPILFLQVEKFFSLLLPNSEYGLRLFPLFAFWVSSYLFYKILNLIFKNSNIIIVGLSLFLFNATLLYFSSEVKQYMIDVLVLLGLYFLVLKPYKEAKTQMYLLGIFGAISIMLSNVSPILLACIGLHLVIKGIRMPKSNIKSIFVLFGVLGVTFLIYYVAFIHHHPTKDFMLKFWTKNNAFMPINPFDAIFYRFFYDKVLTVFYYFFTFGTLLFISFIFFYCLGIFYLVRFKKIDFIILTLVPFMLHLILSSFKLYPFHERLLLYNIPLIIFVFLLGFQYLASILYVYFKGIRFGKLYLFIPIFLIFNVLSFSNSITKGFPMKRDEIKESIQYIEKMSITSDRICVYFAALCAFQYYQDINFMATKKPTILGCWDKNIRLKKTIDDFNQLKGKNWLLFSQVFDNEEAKMIHYLDSLGYPKLNSFKTNGSSAYYYDFGGKE